MATTRVPRRHERLEARIPWELKEQIQEAAALLGRTPTAFVVGALQEAAEATIRTHRIMELTDLESEVFLAALEHPATPNEHLQTAADRYGSLHVG